MKMNPAIESFLQYRPSDKWICENSNLAWLQLDIEVPYLSIADEAHKVFASSVDHRETDTVVGYANQGWRSVCLHGVDSAATSQDTGPMQWTDMAEQCPTTLEWLREFWQVEQAGRIRFMWLAPQGYIMPHNDRTQRLLAECNIAIEHPKDCRVQFIEKGTIPFDSGRAFIIDTSYKHFVVNPSDQWRLHVIVHAPLKPGIVRRSYAKSFYC